MPDKKEMNKAVLIQAIGVILILVVPRLMEGVISFVICLVIGVPVIGIGYRKYRQAKNK